MCHVGNRTHNQLQTKVIFCNTAGYVSFMSRRRDFVLHAVGLGPFHLEVYACLNPLTNVNMSKCRSIVCLIKRRNLRLALSTVAVLHEK